jgi:hypothetical protein
MHAKVKTWLIISAVLFLVSLIVFITASAQSSEIKQETMLLNYEHQGRFDYIAHQKASYLFDDILPETNPKTEGNPEINEIPKSLPSAPKYPIDITERFDMTYTYKLIPDQDEMVTRISGEVEVKAVLRKPGEDPETVILVPNTTRTGPLAISFSLDASEINLSHTTTITASVYTTIEAASGPIFERFTQSLTINSDGRLLELDENLSHTQRSSFGELSYKQIGEFDYSVLLKPNSPWGAITVVPPPGISPSPPPSPPPTLPPLSSKTLGPEDPIFLNLLDSIDATFSYNFRSDKHLRQVTTEVEINAILEGAELWSKSFPLVSIEGGRDLSVGFTLDLIYYIGLVDIIREETGASAEAYGLSIIADVHTIAETDFGKIDEVFSQTLSTSLGGGNLGWNEELSLVKPGSITKTESVPNPSKYLGLSPAVVTKSSTAAIGIFFLLLLFSVVLFVRFKPVKLSPIDEEVQRVHKKYGKLMAEATVHKPTGDEIIISLGSMEDLTRIADEIGKPIIHLMPTTAEGSHTYYILDGVTRYQYLLTINEME